MTESYGNRGAGYVSPIGILNILLRQRRILIAVPVVCVAIAVGFVLAKRDEYIATSQFLLTGGQQGSAASVLAAQLGFGAAGSRGESPELYASLVESQGVLRHVAAQSFIDPDGSRQPLPRIYGIEGGDTEDIQRATVAALKESIETRVNPTTGVVAIDVTAATEALAVELADALVGELARFNVENRQRQAEAEREFIEGRVAAAQSELARAEERLRDFLQRNRTYATSPELSREHASLQRDVTFRQQLFTSLAQSFEQARIDEVRNTPIFTVVERAEHTVRPRSESLVLLIAAALLGGLFAGLAIAFTRDFLRRGLSGDASERAELDRLMSEMRPRQRKGSAATPS